MFLFKASVAYALRQYYSQKRQTLLFTSVSCFILRILIKQFILLFNLDPVLLMYFDIIFSLYPLRSENIITFDETPRISFYMRASEPGNPSAYISTSDLKAAIRLDSHFIYHIKQSFGLHEAVKVMRYTFKTDIQHFLFNI